MMKPTLFKFFLDRIMSDALREHNRKVSIGGRTITNLPLSDDIVALAEEEQELEALVDNLNKTCTMYKMEISAERTKVMTNSSNDIQMVDQGKRAEAWYRGVVVADDGS